MASKKDGKRTLAARGDTAGMAAIRIWSMEIESAMIRRYVGNAPTLTEIKKIAAETVRKIHGIQPALMSDCDGWTHLPSCECDPTI
jgi:hypothetical protein